jgi:tetratricopeptide (TPR) repeat protein
MTDAGATSREREPLTRPRRLAPRYPVQLRVRVRGPEQVVREYDARDVSRGGLFIASDSCPELFAEVDVWLPLPEGGEAALRARVMRVVSASKAETAGMIAGMGLAFDALTASQADAVTSVLSAARAANLRRRTVKLRRDADRSQAELDAMLAYLLDAIDGQTDPEGLSERLGIPLDTTEEMLHELLRLQLIELGAESAAAPKPPVTTRTKTHATPETRTLAGIGPTVRAQLEALWLKLDELNHYEMLGIPAAASGEHIRRRFFELGKIFHPDAYYGRPLGDDLRKLERVFARLSEAYAALSREKSRMEYDRYLANKHALAQAQEPRTQPSAAPLAAATPHIIPRSTRHRTVVSTMRERPALPAETLMAAERAHDDGRLADAHRLLAGLRAVRIADRRLQRRIVSLRSRVAHALHAELTSQARYEEQHQKWAEAAQSWLSVCEGEPHDPDPHRAAALALVEARGDVQEALRLAKHAVGLLPDDAETRRVLARVYLAAGLRLNARHELELATQLAESTADRRQTPHCGASLT